MKRGSTPSSAAAVLRRHCPESARLAVVLGSGFHAALSRLKTVREIAYTQLPGFPRPTVAGHAGKVIVARLGATTVLAFSGRAHFYEGQDMETVTFAVRAMAEYGVEDLLLTNAAGGINPRFRPGDFMLLTDHINAMGSNPLRGPAPARGQRFVDLTEVYDTGLRATLIRAARAVSLPLRRGVYLAVSGPSYETPAEIRAFARLGADAVGMSTVPEAIAARQRGLRVAGLSCITNLAAGLGRPPLSHAEVLAMGEQSQERAAGLVEAFVRLYAQTKGR